ncbi:MAG: copper chaperone PCu(A)C [Alcanivoracaceae bacterium]|nr:copper chaperone PCu(A)C [Alcanivoracaceae bacterium]
MKKYSFMPILILFLITFFQDIQAASRWGADYFPNVILTNQNGDKFKFFDDLIKDKIVVINFIYTSCPDVCPLETAQLTRVQRILGDRLGKDIFFYSISIDPENDTPEVLQEYRERFGAKWMFFTGDKNEIITLRRKLGLYIEDIEGGENNHNVSMIIGNQKTGRWMKRSPFENPYVLADQIGNWLTGWKAPQQVKDFANAPELRNLTDGENLYRTRCSSCHTIDGNKNKGIGPDLLGVHLKRDRTWLINWLRAPDKMLKEKDPIAMKLFEEYNRVVMPNMSLTQVDVMDLLQYMSDETEHVMGSSLKNNGLVTKNKESIVNKQGDIVAIMNSWIREALPGAKVNGGYMTLINVNEKEVKLLSVDSEAFEKIEIHKMSIVDGMMEMAKLPELVIPAGSQVHLKPGSTHLMLKRPKRDLVRGDVIELVMTFSSGMTQKLNVTVDNK